VSAPTLPDAPLVDDIPALVELPPSRRHRVTTGVTFVVVGVLTGWLLGFGSHAGYKARFGLSATGSAHPLTLTLPARATVLVLAAVVVAIGVWQIAHGLSRRGMRWAVGVTVFAVAASFLVWSCTGTPDTSIDLLGLLQNTIFLAVPLILGSLSGIVCERSAVINVAIEGQMLTGAFMGALFASITANLGLGVLAAVLSGALMGALLAVFAIRYLVNQVVLGVVINTLALGLTGFLYDAFMAQNANTYNNPGNFPPIRLPLLGDIPVIGPLFFDANILVYATYVLVVLVDVWLFRTRWGLRTRAVGEHPEAADTMGINVIATRYRNVIIGGMFAGLAGAYLTVGSVGQFEKNMSAGKGFIALAAVIFGRWNPRGALGAALLFGFTEALQTVLTIIGTPVSIPSAFLSMLPYLATIFAVAGLVGHSRAPAADGVPYVKE